MSLIRLIVSDFFIFLIIAWDIKSIKAFRLIQKPYCFTKHNTHLKQNVAYDPTQLWKEMLILDVNTPVKIMHDIIFSRIFLRKFSHDMFD